MDITLGHALDSRRSDEVRRTTPGWWASSGRRHLAHAHAASVRDVRARRLSRVVRSIARAGVCYVAPGDIQGPTRGVPRVCLRAARYGKIPHQRLAPPDVVTDSSDRMKRQYDILDGA